MNKLAIASKKEMYAVYKRGWARDDNISIKINWNLCTKKLEWFSQKTNFGIVENGNARAPSSAEIAEDQQKLVKKGHAQIQGWCASKQKKTFDIERKCGRLVFQTRYFGNLHIVIWTNDLGSGWHCAKF